MDLVVAKGAVDFDNSGAVIGDVAFGDYTDTLHVFGSAAQDAT